MGKKIDAHVDMGNSAAIAENVKTIIFEGDNEQFFWRVSGNVLNPDAEVIVPETHQVVFVKDGIMNDILEAGRHRIFETQKAGFLGMFKKKVSANVDLIFLSKTCKVKVLWGTRNPIKLRDPITEIPVTLRGNGEFTVQILNPRQFYLTIVGSDKNFTIESLQQRLAGRMMLFVEDVIAKVMQQNGLSYVDISSNKKYISDEIFKNVIPLFDEEFGLKVSSFTVYNMGITDEEIIAIENELALRREEMKVEKNAKEIAAEIERLQDKQWEREMYLKKLQQLDYEKYLEVCKLIGWDKDSSNKEIICPKCGTKYPNGTRFCSACGTQLTLEKKKCSKCGHENEPNAGFCSNCGNKL